MRRLVVAAALVACHHDATGPISNTPVEAKPGYSGNDLDLIPADVELVMGVNWTRAMRSPLYGELVAPRLATALDFDKFRTLCGFDPIGSLTSLTLGMRGLDEPHPEGVAIVHGFDRDKVLGCVQKIRPQIEKDGTKLVVDNDTVVVTDLGGKAVAMGFLDDHTALFASGAHATRAGLAALTKQTTGLRSSPAFVDMYSKVRTTDVMWGLVNGSSKALRSMPVKVKAAVGSMDVTDGLAFDVHLVMNSPPEADQFATLLRQQASQLTSMVDHFDVAATGAEVGIKVTMSHQKVTALVGLLGGLGPSPPPPPIPPPPPPAPPSP